VPLVWNDLVVDKIQIAQAAAYGAAAITLTPDITEDLVGLVEYCEKLKIEPIVFVKDLNQGFFFFLIYLVF
jgi:indole-3-glycerol phosphate synthase